MKKNTRNPALARRRTNTSGTNLLEFTLLMPMFVFMFIGAFDWGIYAQTLISIENGLRVATVYASSTAVTAIDSTRACAYFLEELRASTNLGGVTSCNSLPLIVTASQIVGVDGNPAAQVSVKYQTPILVSIPGALTNRLTISRVLQMRLRG